MSIPTYTPTIRVPNLPLGAIVDENGYPTAEEQTFRQALITLLQNLFGDTGMIMPAQTATNMTTIQDNTQPAPGTTQGYVYTCQYGQMLYNSTDNSVQIAINSGDATGSPVFKTVTLT